MNPFDADLERSCLHLCKFVSFDLHKASKVSPQPVTVAGMILPGHGGAGAVLYLGQPLSSGSNPWGGTNPHQMSKFYITVTQFSCDGCLINTLQAIVSASPPSRICRSEVSRVPARTSSSGHLMRGYDHLPCSDGASVLTKRAIA